MVMHGSARLVVAGGYPSCETACRHSQMLPADICHLSGYQEATLKAVLTDKLLRAIAAKGEPHEQIADQHTRGLTARIGERGRITFSAVARQRGGSRVPVRLHIGAYPIVTLAEARERARSLLRDLADGIDPRQRRAEQQRAEAVEKAHRFDTVAEDFIHRHVARARTARAIELRIRRELISRWASWPIGGITRSHVVAMVDELVSRGHPEAARQSLVYARRLFSWAIARGLLAMSPCDHLSGRDLIGAKKPRQRLLSDSELVLIWRATAELRYPDDPYIRLLLLLGLRRSELGRARWGEIDLERARWIVPSTRMKSDEAHVVPLPPVAVEILRALPHFASGYVFAARGTLPLNDYGAIKTKLDNKIVALNGAPLEPWTLHDCRRTFRTGLSTLRIAPHIAELCLAHAQPGLARTYDLHRFEPEKWHALEAWAAHLMRIVESPPAVVIPLPARG
jgi:integrase